MSPEERRFRHELNNRLNGLVAYAEFVKMAAARGVDPAPQAEALVDATLELSRFIRECETPLAA